MCVLALKNTKTQKEDLRHEVAENLLLGDITVIRLPGIANGEEVEA